MMPKRNILYYVDQMQGHLGMQSIAEQLQIPACQIRTKLSNTLLWNEKMKFYKGGVGK